MEHWTVTADGDRYLWCFRTQSGATKYAASLADRMQRGLQTTQALAVVPCDAKHGTEQPIIDKVRISQAKKTPCHRGGDWHNWLKDGTCTDCTARR